MSVEGDANGRRWFWNSEELGQGPRAGILSLSCAQDPGWETHKEKLSCLCTFGHR